MTALTVDELMVRVRAAHLLVRTAEEWTDLNFALVRAYQAKDDEGVDSLIRPSLHAWRSVGRHMVADELEAIGITVSAPSHQWGVAVLSTGENHREPLLCDVGNDEDPNELYADAAVYGGLRLNSFDGVMNAYHQCLRDLMG